MKKYVNEGTKGGKRRVNCFSNLSFFQSKSEPPKS